MNCRNELPKYQYNLILFLKKIRDETEINLILLSVYWK